MEDTDKIVPLLSYLSATPWRRTVQWNIAPPFLTSTLDGGDWPPSHPCCFYFREVQQLKLIPIWKT
jgi:hypothetical protein